MAKIIHYMQVLQISFSEMSYENRAVVVCVQHERRV